MRTPKNCSLIKRAVKLGEGECGSENGKCIGYAGADADEPCETCKYCKFNVWYEEDR